MDSEAESEVVEVDIAEVFTCDSVSSDSSSDSREKPGANHVSRYSPKIAFDPLDLLLRPSSSSSAIEIVILTQLFAYHAEIINGDLK